MSNKDAKGSKELTHEELEKIAGGASSKTGSSSKYYRAPSSSAYRGRPSSSSR